MPLRGRLVRTFFQRSVEGWARATYRYRWWIIPLMLLLAAGPISQIRELTFDTSTEGLLAENDPVLASYNAFRDQFGRDGHIIIAIEPPEVFDVAFLETLRAFHREIEETVPKIQKVTSLINVRNTRGVGDTLVVEDLLEELPRTQQELETLRERVLRNALYENLVISRDGSVAALLIETDAYSSLPPDGSGGKPAPDMEAAFDEWGEDGADATPPPFLTGEENAEIVQAVSEIIARYEGPAFRIHASGVPWVVQQLQSSMGRDMKRFMGLAIGVVAAFLFLLFRRISAVVLPLFAIGLSLLSTLGLMGLLGIPITSTTQILPSFLLAVGTGYGVHLLVVFFERFDESGDKEESLVYALGHSGLPILMTALTTSVGMLSFTAAELRPIAMFGVFVPLGVLMAFIYNMVLLPALLAVFPMLPKRAAVPSPMMNGVDRVLVAAGSVASRHPWPTVAMAALVVVVSLLGAMQIRFSHNSISWFPEEGSVRKSSEYIDERLGGTISMEVVIDTGRENGLHDPEVLNRIEAIDERTAQFARDGLAQIGKTVSLLQIVKETHRALNANDEAYYAIPRERKLVAQELLLFENSDPDDLEDFVDSQFSMARFTIKSHRRDAYEDVEFVKQAAAEYQRIMGDEAEVVITGLMPMVTRAVLAVIRTLTKSYALAFLMITPLMMLLIGSFRAGLVSMVPNLAPIIITLGLMGWCGFPMDIFTLLIGCIAIGLAVDDTIHLIHSFQRYVGEHGDAELAVRQTLETTGKALLFTSLVLCSSFFIFTASSMHNVFRFGLLTGFTIATAFLFDILVTPALLVLIARTRETRS